jgi:ribosomal protein S18 acetylase RimI-like enzyme
MELDLDQVTVGSTEVEVVRDDWAEYVRILDVPGFLPQADPSAYFTVVGLLDGENVGSAMAFDHDGDCGIYNVGTEDRARRRGVGTAMTARLLLDARDRGCRTATLQSTPIGEGVYARLGFRSLGTIREFVPA